MSCSSGQRRSNQTICRGPAGKRPIHELSLAEVRQYDCGGQFNPTFPHQTLVPGARIPTVVTGAADVVLANFAVTLERAKSIMSSPATMEFKKQKLEGM